MAKGENIFKRKDGRWEARYVKGRDHYGKIKYGFCYGKTYKEAKQKANRCKAAQIIGFPISTSPLKQPLSAFCDEWLRVNRSKYRESTLIKYTCIIEKHIKPQLGSYSPSKINEEVIGAFTEKLVQEDGLSPKTTKDILMVFKSILKYAERQFPYGLQRVEINYPNISKKEMRVLSQEEQETLVKYLAADMDECKFGILFALLTGARIGEICALRWDHVSLSDNSVRIVSTMQRLKDMSDGQDKTRVVIGPPKSDHSMRIIPFTHYTAELCRQMNPGNPAAFLLTGTGQYMEPRTLQYRLARYTKECGLEGVHFHTLRHTFATRAVEVGFDIKSLSEIMGHSTTTVTLEKYVHSNLEQKRCNMDKLALAGL